MEKHINKIALLISIASIIVVVGYIAYTQSNASTHVTSSYVGKKRDIYLFTSEMAEFNETRMGMPKDTFTPDTISVYKGDTLVIHFFNAEAEGGDKHSFTIYGKPYDVNVVLDPGQNKTITIDANTTGIYQYICTFHPPTMTGHLAVLDPPT
ncbi:MAG: cupredoxin domain-containing protein [Thaumarchaeota archaeon]|nr:cupredoxin domain-containing protein [Nitrososphaerota archaeon]MDE1832009.1 cupredoxin domain-containing protein [Nitrososphaerota archaeon]MDE1840716.1 cupredoxin domain-containing protein [Nitrososphaerota archaeon]MDE1878104.1 cupredoxin domain-containing protein [Nitrososphaerota archaeon]